MIEKRTTLILGAGASAAYGFPVASTLRFLLLENDVTGFGEMLSALGRKPEAWSEVQELLRDFQRPTIDEFLGTYSRHGPLTKIAIAHHLNRHEQLVGLTSQNEDPWYRSLFDEHLGRDRKLGGGRLTVVTFNYDLSLEAYLLRTLKVRFDMSDDQAVEALRNLDIQHIYGDIGPLVQMDPAGRKYGKFESAQILAAAAERISTCMDLKSTAAVAEAQRQIRESECLVFLGFGYAEENLNQLDLKAHLRSDARVAGSTMGVEDFAARMRPHLHPGMPFHTTTSPGGANATTIMLRGLLTAIR